MVMDVGDDVVVVAPVLLTTCLCDVDACLGSQPVKMGQKSTQAGLMLSQALPANAVAPPELVDYFTKLVSL